jgi:hypothetical protein
MPEERVTHDAATLEALEKAKILDELHDNAETRPLLFQGIKTIRPQARIPEVESAKAVLQAIEPHMKTLGETKAALDQERAEAAAERARDKAQKTLGLDDETFAAVTKLAEEKRIGDLETAAEHYRMTQQVAEPRTGPDTTFHAPNMKGLWENPIQWSRDEARRALHELDLAKRSARR